MSANSAYSRRRAGRGQVEKVSWDEALDYVAQKIAAVQQQHIKEAVLSFPDRDGLYRPVPWFYARPWFPPMSVHTALRAI